ncbi:FolM Alternative dihydrofolate reductase 1 [Sandaracinus amylolyticus]|nr:FolM Alternative dihydrofolate reductase 1 [Sandaracinus amylolyticus]
MPLRNRQVSRAEDLQGRVALVTGGGRRVGAAIARALGRSGARVAVHHHGSAEGALAVRDELRASGLEAETFRADLGDPRACEALVDAVVARFGRLDHLIASAAIFERVELGTITSEDFDRTIALNVRAPMLLAQRAAPALRDARGSIVIITCTSATAPYRNFLPYVVSKGAAKQLMRTLALELAPEVRVNAVAPGTVLPPESMDDEEKRVLAERTLLQRLGSAEDVADAVLYLVRAGFVTGQEILVDGGVAMTGRPSGEG